MPAGVAPPALLHRVESLEVKIDPASFPTIHGRIIARDVDGETVAGIPGSAFQVAEDSRSAGAMVLGIQDNPPRVACLFDVSSSVPDEFRLSENVAALGRSIADRVTSVFPGAELRVGSIGVPALDPVGWSGDWTGDPSQVEANAAQLPSDGSELWAAIATAGLDFPSVIVVVTDGEPTDVLTPERQEAIQAGPPVVIIRVGTSTSDLPTTVAAFSHGRVFPASMRAEAVDAIADFVASAEARPVSFSYEAPRAGASTRAVEVLLGSKSASTTYEVPSTPAFVPTRFGGLRLVLELGEQRVSRDLAGWLGRESGPVTGEDVAETQNAFFGLQLISFEGGSPPLLHLVDDAVTARLERRGLVGALERRDGAALFEELAKVSPGYGASMISLHGPYGDDELDTIPYLRALRFSMQVKNGGRGATLRFGADVLPFTRFFTKQVDRRAALVDSMSKSVQLQLIEGKVARESSIATLQASAALKRIAPESLETDYPGLGAALHARWQKALSHFSGWLFVAPSVGTAIAFFAIDPLTGTVIGASESGSGDAFEFNCAPVRGVNVAMTAMNLFVSAAVTFGWLAPEFLLLVVVAKALTTHNPA
ncbi:MAG: hypothetical protein HY791_38420 [Deltaproteobacteria bacterium]|nr:hypothetical protein [Deltaproteobacteria bacterium]